MKIVVFIKQIAQIYARTGREADRHFITNHDRIYRINPYDEAAMQLAAAIKKKHDKVRITAVIFGALIAEAELYRCLALGADEVLRIRDASDRQGQESPDAGQKSKIFANAIAELNADVILCGKKSLDTGSGQVGAFMAHHLDCGFVSAVTQLSIDPSARTAQAQRKCGRGVKEIIECRLPAVFSVGRLDRAVDLPAWEDKQNAKAMTFKEVAADVGQTRARLKSQKIFAPRPRPKAVSPLNTKVSSHDRILQLLSPGRIKKKGELKKGTPDELADILFLFLKDNGFLPKDADQ